MVIVVTKDEEQLGKEMEILKMPPLIVSLQVISRSAYMSSSQQQENKVRNLQEDDHTLVVDEDWRLKI